MPATPATIHKQKQSDRGAPAPKTTRTTTGKSAEADARTTVRLHITPFSPALLKVYLAPSVLPLATNISYHAVETFPEKGFGYVELPEMEAQKLKKKLNGATLKGSKVRIEDAKPEKRKAAEDAEAVVENGDEGRLAKRSKKEKRKKEQGVLEGVELPEDRKVKRGWTEPATRTRRDRKEKKEKKKAIQKDSKYTKEPELLFKARLTPIAATEVTRKEKKGGKEKKKDKRKSSKEVVVHEFEKNTKTPSFLKAPQVPTEKKPAVEYVNGTGWIDEDGNVVEAETGKARNRRTLELVDAPAKPAKMSASPQPTTEKQLSVTPEPQTAKPKAKPKKTTKKAKTPPSSSESESEESSVVSSSSEDESESEAESEAESSASSPALAADAPQMVLTPSSPRNKKEVHPLEALFKRPRPPTLSTLTSEPVATPPKNLAPINTSFSFFDNDSMDVDPDASGNFPATPFTKQDLEWRGLRSAAPTPDTAAIGRRFSFSWRTSSQEADDDDDDEEGLSEAGKQLNDNTKANASTFRPAPIAEALDEDASAQNEEEEDEESNADANQTPLGSRRSTRNAAKGDGEKEESEFGKWFWENRGENNRAWKKRRREGLRTKRLRENKKITGGKRLG